MVGATVACRPATPEPCGGGWVTGCPTAMAMVDNAAMQAWPLERRYGTMEKVISEFKVIETEDGFRIEIKGNKEAIRRMLSGIGLCDSFSD